MNLKELKRKAKKQHPKAWARAEKRWDVKMTSPVTIFCMGLLKHIPDNPKKAGYKIDAPAVEEELWKLLVKVRRITQREKNK